MRIDKDIVNVDPNVDPNQDIVNVDPNQDIVNVDPGQPDKGDVDPSQQDMNVSSKRSLRDVFKTAIKRDSDPDNEQSNSKEFKSPSPGN